MSISSNLSSKEKLMLTAIDLISKKGYKSVTTQEIATTAGLSEKTLFRHFGTKQNLLETAFDQYHYAEEMTRIFNEKLVWDLYTDLLLISKTYHNIMNRNRKLFMISLKEVEHLPGYRERTVKHPQQLLEILTNYFNIMFDKGKLVQINPELQAFSFMSLNYGVFINNLEEDVLFPGLSLEGIITESVWTFTRALTP
ncbi:MULTISPECIES: TetR/AcrR family transcriptional regulator [Paenibacillus]|uniref:TetR/AcrR family transcriptional regulator n=1 Tax=Paenibacillus TaxID=44249 RepID=UPI00105A18BB|nr:MULTISPECIES: TetR/AcrR family transcriptional regulator [Paenibacillus]MCL6658696.1 TetR/AcrR family transcriptional regulator [Paenibacillus amylolyticus]TDL70853.1 TetR/AcrR family transcriptional regulator [Paenibacillus amylolyticus]WJM11069.1 TetR/AcrR family transcriptional regulator [Paenibacillus sp. PK1-4R]